MNLRQYKTVTERRRALAEKIGQKLSAIGRSLPDEELASKRHCENMIGSIGIPVGVAGPLEIVTGKGGKRSVYLPLATTEGALVASINRGARAITASGGATVLTDLAGATRGPVFRVENLSANRRLGEFLDKHESKLAQITAETSRHLKLIGVDSQPVGRYRFVRFAFDSKDAMGMNMVTLATQAAADYIVFETGAECLSLAGNYDVDKKPSWLNIINGRGYRAWAEAVLPEKVVESVLKTDAQKITKVWLSKCLLGSAVSGSMAFNCHFANTVSALFIATGQDPAHVVEASLGITTVETEGSSTVISVYLPDLMLGTVGGGTELTAQKEALSIMGITGGNDGQNRQTLAENVAAAVLAGEISLLASLAEGSLARAHEKLARGKEII